MKLYFNIPRPEDLDDDDWVENVKQLQWLADKGLLGMKRISGHDPTN